MEQSKQASNRWLGLVFVSVSLLVIALDNTILNVALPSISRQLGASASELQWVIDAYVLVFAALLLTMGAIGDRIGRKRALQFGLLWFGAGSVLAANATSTEMLIASRALLGIGGATIMPSTLSIVTATFRDPKERSQAIAIWAAVFGLGIGIGPVIGGLLLKYFDWNAVFYINLPVVAVALIGGHFFIQESKDEDAPRPDIPGVILSITGLFALVYAIIEAGIAGWTADNVVAAFAIAGVLLTVFAIWEYRAPNAMLPLHFFRNMSFTGANTALALVTFSLFGSVFFFSQYFQSVQKMSALEAGLRLLPMSLVLMVAAAMSARVAGRFGVKMTVGVGIFFAASGLFLLSQLTEPDTPYLVMLGGLSVLSVGMGLAMSPATDSIMGAVPVRKAGIGSAMNDTTRQLGGALGVAVLGTIMNDIYLNHIAALDEVPLLQLMPAEVHEAIRSSIQGAHIVADNVQFAPAAQLIIDTADQAFSTGMAEAMLIGSAIMLVASLVTFAILPSEIRRSKEPEELEETPVEVPEEVGVIGAPGD